MCVRVFVSDMTDYILVGEVSNYLGVLKKPSPWISMPMVGTDARVE